MVVVFFGSLIMSTYEDIILNQRNKRKEGWSKNIERMMRKDKNEKKQVK